MQVCGAHFSKFSFFQVFLTWEIQISGGAERVEGEPDDSISCLRLYRIYSKDHIHGAYRSFMLQRVYFCITSRRKKLWQKADELLQAIEKSPDRPLIVLMKLLVVQKIAHPVRRGFHEFIDTEALRIVEGMGNRAWNDRPITGRVEERVPKRGFIYYYLRNGRWPPAIVPFCVWQVKVLIDLVITV